MALTKGFALKSLVIGILSLGAFSASAALVKPLSRDIFRLDLASFDSLNRALEIKNNECKGEDDDVYYVCMQEIFEVILGRRSQDDGTLSRLYSAQVKRISEVDRQKVFSRLITDNTERLKESDLSLENRATALEVLVNLTKELDPRKEDERKHLQTISDREIEIPSDVKRIRAARMGLKVLSPSIVAQDLLEKTKGHVKEIQIARANEKTSRDEVYKSNKDKEQPAQGMEELELGY